MSKGSPNWYSTDLLVEEHTAKDDEICYGKVKDVCEDYGSIEANPTLNKKSTLGQQTVSFHFNVYVGPSVEKGDRVAFILKKETEDSPAACSVWCIPPQWSIACGRHVGAISKLTGSTGYITVFKTAGDQLEDVSFEVSQIRCAGFQLLNGDILEFNLEPCEKGLTKWSATSIHLKELRPRQEETIASYINSQNILELLHFSAFWKLCSHLKGIRGETIKSIIELITSLEIKSRQMPSVFKEALGIFLSTELFRQKEGPLFTWVSQVWGSDNEGERECLQKFLLMIVSVLPEKACVVTSLMEPAISTDPLRTDNFMFRIVKKLSVFRCTDVDDLPWNKIPHVPSTKELLQSQQNDSALAPVKVKGPYYDPDVYMDTYFQLLRADCFDSLRIGIQEFLSGTRNHSGMNMYIQVSIKGINIGGNNLPISIALQVTPARRISNWKFSSDLMYGNLLCISPCATFKDAIWATVVHRDVEELQKQNLIWVSLCDEYNTYSEAHCISVLQRTSGKIIMAESPTYYHAYKPVLKALQAMTPADLPFVDELVYARWQKPSSMRGNENETEKETEKETETDSILPGALSPRNVPATPLDSDALSSVERYFYLTEDVSSFSADKDQTQSERGGELKSSLGKYTHDMDKSQALAFESCLKEGISVIQGPPGTGKTFVGLRLVKYFHENPDLNGHPILVLTYKNHALDEMLKSVLTITKSIVRVGGKSKEPDLAKYNLQALKREQRIRSLSRKKLLNEANEIKMQIQSTFDTVKTYSKCSSYALMSYLDSEQIKIFLERCPWRKVPFDRTNRIWTKKGVMRLWQEHRNRSHENALDDIALEGDLLIAFQDAIHFWLPSPDIFGSQRNLEEKASKMLASVLHTTRNVKEQYKKSQLEDNGEDEDDIEVKQKEEERLLSVSSPQRKGLDIHVELQQGSHSYLDISNTVTPPQMLLDVGDLWSKDAGERAIIAQVITQDFQTKTELVLQSLIDQYKRILSSINQLHSEEKIRILENAAVVGMTITGASMYQTLVKGIRPSIVLVEEAAEVLEPQILAVLGHGVQRLIMIGDHKQLKPPVESYRLRNCHFDLSMMERLINNGYSYSCLAMQNRMLPEMATLLKDIYPELESNLETVSKNTRPDFTEPIFFWDHTDKENSDGRSYSNKREAFRVIAVARLFIKQGYPADRVTVLSAYQGQAQLLRRLFREQRTRQKRSKEYAPGEIPNIQTIDSYQGDENDIVIVSLVRSNRQGKLGFLDSLNRRCVAQSRARCGMYFVGSKSTLYQSINGSWKYFLDQLEAQNRIGPDFPIHCPKHPEVKIKAVDSKSIPEHSICEKPCSSQMECGVHRCPKSCQPPHEHSSVHCRSFVEFTFSCCHSGRRCCDPEQSNCRQCCEKHKTSGHHQDDRYYGTSRRVRDRTLQTTAGGKRFFEERPREDYMGDHKRPRMDLESTFTDPVELIETWGV